ncbi:MAG: hypothetical protein MK135_17575, partial [Polyangiaceae bacterium]|nr:hypothetical protein [Polyangiaceae bacterium]
MTLVASGVSACLTPEFEFSEDTPSVVRGMAGQPAELDESHCENRELDADETDIDCGGQDCVPCAEGRRCSAAVDCVNQACSAGFCAEPSCSDGEKNGVETDVDCGGENCLACAVEERCELAQDCESLVCSSGLCRDASCGDQTRNGDESGVDCGGSCAPCDFGGSCLSDADCVP